MDIGSILIVITCLTLIFVIILFVFFIVKNNNDGSTTNSSSSEYYTKAIGYSTCTTGATAGQPCVNNCSCLNNSCGFQTAGIGAPLICCPSEGTELFAGFNYCTEMINGSTCWTDSMCASNYCEGNAGGLQRGVCIGTGATAGSTCSNNSDCANHSCGFENAGTGAPLICCPSGEVDFYGGYNFCTEMTAGSVCWSDAMCSSNYCKNNAGGLERGICADEGGTGAPCTTNADCQNGACGRKTAIDGAPLICCPSGQTDLYGGFNYCTQMPDGSICWNDVMCLSNYCQGNAGGLQKGTCQQQDS